MIKDIKELEDFIEELYKKAKLVDRNGNDMYCHILSVSSTFDKESEIEEYILSLLHDTVEDGLLTYTEIRELGISEYIITGLTYITRTDKNDSDEYDRYIMRLKNHLLAKTVKIADIIDNLRIDETDVKVKKEGLSEMRKRNERYRKSLKYLLF